MSWLDNGGIVGKKLDLNRTESYLIPVTGPGSLVFVGSANGAILGTASNTSVSLTGLTGGVDKAPLANDLVIVSYATSALSTIDPGAFTSVGTATTDSWCAASLSIKSNNDQTITYVGGTTQTITGSTGTTTNVNLPVGTLANDLVIVSYAIGSALDRRSNLTSGMITQGYTIGANLNVNDTFDGNLGVFYKLMGTTPDTIVTIPATGGIGDAGAVAIQTWRNIDTTKPVEKITTATDISARAPNPPAIGALTNNSIIVVVGAASSNHVAGSETFTAPTGYTTNFQQLSANENIDVTLGMGYRTAPLNPYTDYSSSIGRSIIWTSGYNYVAANVFAISDVSALISHSVAYKIMGSTPDTTVLLNQTGGTTYAAGYTIQVWRFANTTSPFDVTSVAYAQANGTSNTITSSNVGTRQPDPQAVTPTTTGAIIIAAGAAVTSGGAAFTNAGLSGFVTNYSDDSAADIITGMYYDTWTSGSYNPTPFTVASDSIAAAATSITMAIKPTSSITTSTTGNKVYSGNWNNNSKFLAKSRDAEIAQVVSYTTAYTTAAAASLNITLPNDIRVNDVILILAGSRQDSATAAFDNTYKPTGYTFVRNTGTTSTNCQTGLFYKVANGTESGTVLNVPQQSSQHMWAVAIVIRGALTSNPIGSYAAVTEQGTGSSDSFVGIVTSRNHALSFLIIALDQGNGLPVILSPTNGWVYGNNSIQIGTSGTTSGVGGFIAWKYIASSNTSSGTCSASYSTSLGFTGYQFEVQSIN